MALVRIVIVKVTAVRDIKGNTRAAIADTKAAIILVVVNNNEILYSRGSRLETYKSLHFFMMKDLTLVFILT